MRRAIRNLEQLSDNALFQTLSEGMPLIVDNADGFDETAHRLYRDGEFRASEIMRGLAEEEAAKVLILIDYVRCPRSSEGRAQVLNRFYGHVAKRIHAMACEYPDIASFGELSDWVEHECRPWYLDGPKGVDWVFPNSISEKRERDLYVDYVQDVTDAAAACYWIAPASSDDYSQSQYPTSDCVMLVQSLSGAGAVSADGLAEIADVWRSFAPEPCTDREELHRLIAETLDRLAQRCGALEEAAAQFIVSHWPFPLWPLTIREPRPNDGDLNSLRKTRERAIEWIMETEAKRDPAPAISRLKVEELSNAYAVWRSDVGARTVHHDEGADIRLRIQPVDDGRSGLPSYARLQNMFRGLTAEERAALLALGWFAREQVADWPRIHERAVKAEPTTNENYQISRASYWLAGLERWEEKPRPFQAGRSWQLR